MEREEAKKAMKPKAELGSKELGGEASGKESDVDVVGSGESLSGARSS